MRRQPLDNVIYAYIRRAAYQYALSSGNALQDEFNEGMCFSCSRGAVDECDVGGRESEFDGGLLAGI